MVSSSETGHVKNVANLDALISFATDLGEDYNPSRENLKLPALQTISKNAKNSIDAVNSALPAYSKAVAARDVAFTPLSRLSTRIFNSLKATDTSDQIDKNALIYIRKIQGRRAVARRTEAEKEADKAAGKETVEISASQMSHNSRIDNLDKLIKLLSSIELYTPNEADLKIVSLKALLEDLKLKNNAVILASTPLSSSRISRNTVLYKENTGLVAVASDAKIYIKSVFGARSPQYRQVSKLAFKTVK